MPSLSIKDVPEPLLEALRRRAARNHRSLQGELMVLIAQAVDEQAAQTASAPGQTPARQKTIEQIAAELAVLILTLIIVAVVAVSRYRVTLD